jgi:hypothetical protein
MERFRPRHPIYRPSAPQMPALLLRKDRQSEINHPIIAYCPFIPQPQLPISEHRLRMGKIEV